MSMNEAGMGSSVGLGVDAESRIKMVLGAGQEVGNQE